MRRHPRVFAAFIRLAVLVSCGALISAQAPAPAPGRGPIPLDPRVQIRTHHFADTNEDIPYALFVSSKVDRSRDEAVPVTLSRTWVDVMKSLKMTYQYDEVPGGTHGSVISSRQPEIFAFFAKYTKR